MVVMVTAVAVIISLVGLAAARSSWRTGTAGGSSRTRGSGSGTGTHQLPKDIGRAFPQPAGMGEVCRSGVISGEKKGMSRSRIGEMVALAETVVRDLTAAFAESKSGETASVREVYAFAFFVVSHTVMLRKPVPEDLPGELQIFGDVMSSAIRLQAYPLLGQTPATPANPDREIHAFSADGR